MRAIGFKAATGEEAAVTQISWERGCFALCHLHSDLIFALKQNYSGLALSHFISHRVTLSDVGVL